MRSCSSSDMTSRSLRNRAPRSRRSSASRLFLLSIALLCSSGCATERSDPGPQIFCPQPKPYTKEFLNKVADELAAHPDLDATVIELEDYTFLRDQLAKCNAGKP